ncbi:hypothetical protein D3C72_1742840 [compost metagenome]
MHGLRARKVQRKTAHHLVAREDRKDGDGDETFVLATVALQRIDLAEIADLDHALRHGRAAQAIVVADAVFLFHHGVGNAFVHDDVHGVLLRIEDAHGAALGLRELHHVAQEATAQRIDGVLSRQQGGNLVQGGQLAFLRGAQTRCGLRQAALAPARRWKLFAGRLTARRMHEELESEKWGARQALRPAGQTKVTNESRYRAA